MQKLQHGTFIIAENKQTNPRINKTRHLSTRRPEVFEYAVSPTQCRRGNSATVTMQRLVLGRKTGQVPSSLVSGVVAYKSWGTDVAISKQTAADF